MFAGYVPFLGSFATSDTHLFNLKSLLKNSVFSGPITSTLGPSTAPKTLILVNTPSQDCSFFKENICPVDPTFEKLSCIYLKNKIKERAREKMQ